MSMGNARRESTRPVLRKAMGVALALGASHALAQDAQNASAPPSSPLPPPPQEKPKAAELDKISVQGEDLEPASPKFTAPLVDTPMSVTILPQSVMEETAAISLQDALRNVPGITFAAGEGATPLGDLPSIRGFSSAGSIYIDSMRDIGVQTRDIFDLEQVEVVKGPDSSIAGRSAGGGAINLVSKSAEASDFLEVRGTYGSAGQYRATFDGNLQLTDDIAARLNFLDMGGGTPGRSSAVRTDKWGIAPTVTVGLSSATRFVLNYYHFEDKSTPDYGIPVEFFDTGRPLIQTQGISPQNFYGLTDRDFRRNPVDSVSVRLEHDFGGSLLLRSQLRYTVSNNDYLLTVPELATSAAFTEEPGLVYRLPVGNHDQTRDLISQTDLSGHFQTGSIRHDIDVGFEASQQKERQYGGGPWDGYTVVSSAGSQGFSGGDCSSPALLASYDCTSLFAPNPHDPWKGTLALSPEVADFITRDYAPYAFDTMTLSPHWKLNAGLRWDRYDTGASDPYFPLDFGGSDQISFLSYQVGLMFKPVEDGTIYLMTSSASIPEDQASSLGGQDQPYPTNPGSWTGTVGVKPEVTHSVELGTKWNLFDKRILLSGDIFDEQHKNTLVYIDSGIAEQIGGERVKGAEISANGSIGENWNVIGGYSYVDAYITNGGLYTEPGHHVPNSPPHTFSLWSTYRPVQRVTLGAGAYYRARQIGSAGPPDEYIDGYWRFDAMAKWQIDPRFSVQLNVQNLADKLYYSKSFYWYALPASGRTWMVTAAVKL
jgi:catecholate siderophore receptor